MSAKVTSSMVPWTFHEKNFFILNIDVNTTGHRLAEKETYFTPVWELQAC